MFETLTRVKSLIIGVLLATAIWAVVGFWKGDLSLAVAIVNGGVAIGMIGLLLLYLDVQKEKENS